MLIIKLIIECYFPILYLFNINSVDNNNGIINMV